jgi:hypothetical protein
MQIFSGKVCEPFGRPWRPIIDSLRGASADRERPPVEADKTMAHHPEIMLIFAIT